MAGKGSPLLQDRNRQAFLPHCGPFYAQAYPRHGAQTSPLFTNQSPEIVAGRGYPQFIFGVRCGINMWSVDTNPYQFAPSLNHVNFEAISG